MDIKSDDMDMQQILKLAKSPAGQALIAKLQCSCGDQVRQATQQARQGSMEDAARTVKQMLSSPEVQKLAKQLGGK